MPSLLHGPAQTGQRCWARCTCALGNLYPIVGPSNGDIFIRWLPDRYQKKLFLTAYSLPRVFPVLFTAYDRQSIATHEKTEREREVSAMKSMDITHRYQYQFIIYIYIGRVYLFIARGKPPRARTRWRGSFNKRDFELRGSEVRRYYDPWKNGTKGKRADPSRGVELIDRRLEWPARTERLVSWKYWLPSKVDGAGLYATMNALEISPRLVDEFWLSQRRQVLLE